MLDLCTSCPFPLFSLPPFTLFLPLLTPSFAKKNAPQPVSVPSGNSQGPWNRPPCREIVFLRGQARSVAFSVNLAPPPQWIRAVHQPHCSLHPHPGGQGEPEEGGAARHRRQPQEGAGAGRGICAAVCEVDAPRPAGKGLRDGVVRAKASLEPEGTPPLGGREGWDNNCLGGYSWQGGTCFACSNRSGQLCQAVPVFTERSSSGEITRIGGEQNVVRSK